LHRRLGAVIAPELLDIHVNVRHHGLLPDVWQALVVFPRPASTVHPPRALARPRCAVNRVASRGGGTPRNRERGPGGQAVRPARRCDAAPSFHPKVPVRVVHSAPGGKNRTAQRGAPQALARPRGDFTAGRARLRAPVPALDLTNPPLTEPRLD